MEYYNVSGPIDKSFKLFSNSSFELNLSMTSSYLSVWFVQSILIKWNNVDPSQIEAHFGYRRILPGHNFFANMILFCHITLMSFAPPKLSQDISLKYFILTTLYHWLHHLALGKVVVLAIYTNMIELMIYEIRCIIRKQVNVKPALK